MNLGNRAAFSISMRVNLQACTWTGAQLQEIKRNTQLIVQMIIFNQLLSYERLL